MPKILVLNAGSSSLKVALYQEPGTQLLSQAQADSSGGSPVEALPSLLQSIGHLDEIHAVGHRVVHGGVRFRHPVRLTPEVRAAIEQLSEFAPVHNPVAIAGMKGIDRILGAAIPQIAVFDTAFHASLPPANFVYPGPYEWLEQGIRKYGFHGISHQFTSRRTAELLQADLYNFRVITCHLGSGCSLAAIRNGSSINTTMGFTPLDGLMMGSRSGSVDPGILIYLLKDRGVTPDQLDDMLNRHSGLKGISGLSGDMREILAAINEGNPRAQLAFDMYVDRVRSQIGVMISSLDRVDALVFTAGVGENSAPVRTAICNSLEYFGVHLDEVKNAASPVDEVISMPGSGMRIMVVHTDEQWEISRECGKFLGIS
ncbi:MAG: acetate kinase [Bryobacteraceae bacterium]